MNASAAVAARKRLYLFTRNEVEVAGDSVLQCGSRHAEFESRFEIFTVKEALDYAARLVVSADLAVKDW